MTEYLCHQVKERPLSFKSANELRARVASLPGPPPFLKKTITLKGAKTKKAMILYYRDGLELFKYLYGNPLYSNYFDVEMKRVYTDENKTSRIYNEMSTSDCSGCIECMPMLLAS